MPRQVSLRGNRFSVFEKPSRWRTTSMRSAESPRSSTLKAGSRPSRVRVFADQAIADRVERAGPRQAQVLGHARVEPAWAASASAMTLCARRVISSAARRVNVSSSMRSGGTPGEQQVRDPVRERAGLAGAGAGDDQQRRCQQATTRARLTVRRRPPAARCSAWRRRAREGHGRQAL